MNINKKIFKLSLIFLFNNISDVNSAASVAVPRSNTHAHIAILNGYARDNPTDILAPPLDRTTALAASARSFARFVEILPLAELIPLATAIVPEPLPGYNYHHTDGRLPDGGYPNPGTFVAIIRGVYYRGVDVAPFGSSLAAHVAGLHLRSSLPDPELKSLFDIDNINIAMMHVRFVLNVIRPQNHTANLVRQYTNGITVDTTPNVVFIEPVTFSRDLGVKIHFNFGYPIGETPNDIHDVTAGYTQVNKLAIILRKSRGQWIFKTAFPY